MIAPMPFAIRLATKDDLPALKRLMDRSIAELQRGFLDPAQIEASRAVMGIDTQLIADGTYYLVEEAGALAGCGGWSRRATLYGGDHSTDLREPRLLDPASEPARIRAMYTDPGFARRGVGRLVLGQCESAARAEGFSSVELMATLSGRPLYEAAGYAPIEAKVDVVEGVPVPLVRMGKALG